MHAAFKGARNKLRGSVIRSTVEVERMEILSVRLRQIVSSGFVRETVICSVALILGAVAGAVAAKYAGLAALENGSAYVSDGAGGTLFAAAVRVFRLPALICLCACGVFGVFLIPAMLAAHGFLASYSVAILVRCFSIAGFWTGTAVYAVYNLVVLPCVMFMSIYGMSISRQIAGCVFGRGGAVAPDGNVFSRLLVCVVVLLFATALEYWVTPMLLSVVS